MVSEITLNMIVGPFNEPFIAASIASIAPLCSELVLVDTAPGENPNRAEMERTGARIIDLPRKEPFSFAEARNAALEASTTDWIMKFDADEIFHVKHLTRLWQCTQDTKASAIEISFWHHFLHPDLYRIDNNKKCTLIRRNKVHWDGLVHENSSIKGEILKVHDIHFNHYGYVKPQKEVHQRWRLYSSLGGGPDNIDDIPEEGFLDDMYHHPEVLYFKDEHPPHVVPLLKEMFRDFGHFKKPEK